MTIDFRSTKPKLNRPSIACNEHHAFPRQFAQSSGYNIVDIEEPARTTDQLNMQTTEVRALFHLRWLGLVSI